MDPFTIMAIMSVASAGYSIYSAEQQKKQVAAAQGQAQQDMMKSQSDLVASQYKKRRSEGGTLLGQGSAASQAISDRGSILTSNPQTRSLLGG
jgi:hypothetical protein